MLQQYSQPSTPPAEYPCAPSIEATPNLPLPCSPTPGLLQTKPNEFGLYRIYKNFPSCDPEDNYTIDNVSDAPNFLKEPPTNVRNSPDTLGPIHTGGNSSTWFSPFKTPSMSRLIGWFYRGDRKTLSDLNDLVHNVAMSREQCT